jgi:SsrA-binding protein
MKKGSINIVNKKVGFEYFILDRVICGIKLVGSEVKSIRQGKVSLVDSYCYFNNGELFVKGINISENGTSYSHKAESDRKLLLKKRELIKWENELTNHITIVPVRLFENEYGIFKVEICLVKGKKSWDKRNSIKEKDIEREINRKFRV